MRAEDGSPNLINGVSRQAPELRLPSQLQESVNQFPSVSRGLVPRNPAILKGRVSGSPASNSAFHIIDRDATERYVVRISPSGIVVHDFAGNAKTVNTPDGTGYLSGVSSFEDYEALTVADHTFIVNKKKVVAADSTTSDALPKEALIHVVTGDYHSEYVVKVNGSTVAKYITDGGPYTDNDETRKAERTTAPAKIAEGLGTGTVTPSGDETGNGAPTITGGLYAMFGYTYTRYDNVLHLVKSSGSDFTISVDGGGRETAMRVHKGLVKDFTELPRKAPDGFRIKVAGSEDTDYDDYWVEFDQGANDGQGRWKECLGAAVPLRLDASTMPHILVRENDGTFTFKEAPWADREVGDLETNPWPSFVGNTINGLAFTHNRLGLLSGENGVYSRNGEFFNFFIETILTALDTDPIDAAISYEDVSTIYHAVNLAGEQIVFTASIPFRLAGGDILSQKTANWKPTLSNKSSSRVRPVAAGNRLYFVNDADAGCFVHEFVNIQDETIQEAPTITEHVAGYIPGGVFLMDADDDLKMLALVSLNDPTAVYTYKWLWIGDRKAQSAWQKWTLPAAVSALQFVGEELVCVLNFGTSVEHVGINCHEAWSDSKPAILLLDRRVSIVGSYNAGTDRTTFTTPYASPGAIAVLTAGDDFGLQPEIYSDTGTAVVVEGDYGGDTAYVGFVYQAYGILSPFVVREQGSDGQSGNAVPGVSLKVASMRYDTGPSVGLNVTLDRAYRPQFVYRLSAALIGTKTSTLGSLVVGKLARSLSIMADADDVSIRFENDGPYHYSILSYRWTGGTYPKGY